MIELSVKNLSVANNGELLLKKISFELYTGEIYALVGESGSGKSLTSLAMMRLLPNTLSICSGEVKLQEENLFSLTEQAMQNVRGSRVAMIFQDALSSLNPVQTVGQQVKETLMQHRTLATADINKKIIALFEEVGLPDPEKRLSFYPHQLSGGQQQRIMIAIALACEPDILIADEPTTALDVTLQKQVLELIVNLAKNRGLAVLLITHDMGVVKNTANRVGVMYRGEIIEQATTEAFFDSPQERYSQQLIDSIPDMKHYMETSINNSPLLKLNDVAVHFPIRKGIWQRVISHTKAVDGVSLEIYTGQTLALVGESGSGKSTMGRAILNLDPITLGKIYFKGYRIDNLNRKAMLPYRKKIQVIFQSPYSSMNPRMTAGDIIEEGMISLGLGFTAEQRKKRVLSLLERVRLGADFRYRYPHQFSGGQLQRIAIARALAVDPELIICDEPTSALDVSIRAEVLELLLDLQREFGVSYLFITHDLSIVPHLAHHLAVMQNGKIVEQGITEHVLTNPKLSYTKALLASVPHLD